MSVIAQWSKKWAEQQKQSYVFYKSTSSTNDRAKEYLNEKALPSLFIAVLQTQGRGRKKRKWINSDMMLSWCYLLNKAPQPVTTKLMGNALYLSLKKSWKNCLFHIKPPNDIYISGKKMAGLLIEVVSKGHKHLLIVGTGMNVFSHPESSKFTHLQEHIETSITEKDWIYFMTEWKNQMKQQLPFCFLQPNKMKRTNEKNKGII